MFSEQRIMHSLVSPNLRCLSTLFDQFHYLYNVNSNYLHKIAVRFSNSTQITRFRDIKELSLTEKTNKIG